MKQPSIVSSRLIPAANRTGSTSTAYHGRANTAAPPASTSSPTSVAVSNPRPNSRPTGYMCAGLRAGDAVHRSAVVQLLLEGRLVVVAAAHRTPDLHDPEEDDQVQPGDQVQERARDGRPDQAGGLLQGPRVVLHLPDQRLHAEREQHAEAEH